MNLCTRYHQKRTNDDQALAPKTSASVLASGLDLFVTSISPLSLWATKVRWIVLLFNKFKEPTQKSTLRNPPFYDQEYRYALDMTIRMCIKFYDGYDGMPRGGH